MSGYKINQIVNNTFQLNQIMNIKIRMMNNKITTICYKILKKIKIIISIKKT